MASPDSLVIEDGETHNDRVDLEDVATLLVEEGGVLSVDGDAVRLRFPGNNLVIDNFGLIESVEERGRAIDEAGDPEGGSQHHD